MFQTTNQKKKKHMEIAPGSAPIGLRPVLHRHTPCEIYRSTDVVFITENHEKMRVSWWCNGFFNRIYPLVT